MKIIIVGGVAGGATAAARMRRLSEDAEILVLERGGYVSFANCGLPYYIGHVIEQRDALFISTLETIKAKYNLDIRTRSEVIRIDRQGKMVEVKNLETGEVYEESYDKLILSTGSSPSVPPIQGVDAPNVFTLWTIADTDRIFSYIEDKHPQKAVVVGGGFIGVELAENLVERGIDCTLVELTGQIMPPFDPDMTVILEDHMRKNGVKLLLGRRLEAISDGGNTVQLDDGTLIPSDMTLLCTGVRPNNELAKAAGLELAPRGHIVVDQAMRTSDPAIYAVGDVVEVDEPLLGGRTAIPLAGPANRQGRAVCANLLAEGRVEAYRGSIGTSIAKVFDLTAASTGMNEKQLKGAGLVYGEDYYYSLIHPMHHVTYYPGALPMVLKLLFGRDGRVLGAQIVGYQGVDKRIDVISAAIHFKGTVRDLAELELAYAPPYGAAKDPVNFAGFVAENILAGLTDPVTVDHYLKNPDRYALLDIREEEETLAHPVHGALMIPLSQLRQRLDELDREKEYLTFCAIGLRGYIAERILKQKGFTVSNLLGGLRTMDALTRTAADENGKTEANEPMSTRQQTGYGDEPSRIHDLDVSGLSCPGPIVAIGKFIKELKDGEAVRVSATDPGFSRDIVSWCENTGNTLLERGEEAGVYTALVQKGGRALSPAASGFVSSGDPTGKDKTIIVFSGSFDKVMAAFIIALGAAAMGDKVHMFFTFWGLSTLRKGFKVPLKKSFMDKMFTGMIPRGTRGMGLSQMNMMGMAPKMMRKVMKDKGISSLEDLVREAAQNPDIEMTACQMTMDVMGLKEGELIDGVKIGGVASMLNDADKSQFTLFIS